MSQFTFLQQECAPVFGAASEAELAAYADPRTACFYTRRAGAISGPSGIVFEYRSSEASGPAADREEYPEGFFLWPAALWSKINLRNDRQSYQGGMFRIELALDLGTNKALLLKYIHENAASGAQLKEFRQVLPALSRSQIQVLLRELRKEGMVHSVGSTRRVAGSQAQIAIATPGRSRLECCNRQTVLSL